MPSGPITSWQIDGKTIETMTNFIFLGSKITTDGDCSHQSKRCLFLARKDMKNLDNMLKSRDITLPTKIHLVKAMVFLVVMHGCESWTIKKTECQRTDAFELWCWRRFWRVPWTVMRSNHSILKEISPEYSLEGLMLKMKLQYFGHLIQRVDSLEKTLMLGEIGAEGEGDDRGWDGWMESPTRWTWVWVNSGSLWWTGRPGVLRFMRSQRVGHDWATELNWTNGICVLSHSVVSDSLWPHGRWPTRLLCLWGFYRQEYWNGLPCHPPGDLPKPGTEPTYLMSPALTGRFFTTSITWEAHTPTDIIRYICI